MILDHLHRDPNPAAADASAGASGDGLGTLEGGTLADIVLLDANP